ncbi:thioredoxin domain-containing protein [Rhodobacterales bacterium HKCCE2091]|nr:thioredoxin domain-containing protein [Rhodobacterales bacterium HKCCE2091]
MSLRRIAPALCLAAACLATPALATDIDNMTEAEREAFRTEVRAYLLENPEVLMEAISVLEERQANAEAERDLQLVAANAPALFGMEGDYVLGNPDGDITVVEFQDYRCGYCRRAAPEVTELLESDGNIRLIVKEFPILGEQSVLASRFALAARYVAGDTAYEDLHYALIEMRGDMTEMSLASLADDLGYDGTAILAGMDDPRIDEILNANYALAQTMGISGTPTFVFGRQLVRGYIPGAQMEAIVAEERSALQ